MALVAVAAAGPAAALPPFASDVRTGDVDDAELDGISGRYLGASMLVGVRIELVSSLATPQGSHATAAGALYVRRTSGGFDVLVDSRVNAYAPDPDAGATTLPGSASGRLATGGDSLFVQGIGQVTQIAGDGNRMSNLALIRIGDMPGRPEGYNGAMGSQATAGDLVAQVSFVGGGVQLGLTAPGVSIGQQALVDGAGGVMQVGRIAGDGMVASNTLNLQLMTASMPTASLHHLGIQQVLGALSGLRY
ncbi:MAG: hypothetical protein ACOY37_01825 [Pseudomonadota bacterium]